TVGDQYVENRGDSGDLMLGAGDDGGQSAFFRPLRPAADRAVEKALAGFSKRLAQGQERRATESGHLDVKLERRTVDRPVSPERSVEAGHLGRQASDHDLRLVRHLTRACGADTTGLRQSYAGRLRYVVPDDAEPLRKRAARHRAAHAAKTQHPYDHGFSSIS